MCVLKPGMCPLPALAPGLSWSFSPSLPAQTHISEKALAAVPGAEGHISGIQAGVLFFVVVVVVDSIVWALVIIIIINF